MNLLRSTIFASFVLLLAVLAMANTGSTSRDSIVDRLYLEHVESQLKGLGKRQKPALVDAKHPERSHLFSGRVERSEKSTVPISDERPFTNRWRRGGETLLLRGMSRYRLDGKREPKEFFAMSMNGSRSYTLDLVNEHFQTEGAETPSYIRRGQRRLDIEVECVKPIELRFSPVNLGGARGRKLRFKAFDSRENAQKQSLIFRDQLNECVMKITNPYSGAEFGLKLIAEKYVYPQFSEYSNRFEVCSLPATPLGLGPVEELMLTATYNSMTCPMGVEEIEPLVTGREGLQAKVRALLGRDLPESFILAQDPFAPLDMSAAPKLSAVYLSYLVFKADFTGHLIARLLKYHASRGTPVRVLVSNSIARKKDLQMLHELADSSSHIKLMLYKYDSDKAFSVPGKIQELHRSMHVKLFVTVCEESPSCHVAIFGGRNIHDGFLFRERPDYRDRRSMIHYGREEPYTHWADLEVLIRSPQFIRRVIQHFTAFWEHDQETYVVRSLNFNRLSPGKINSDYFDSEEPIVRHFLSIPYSDAMVLQDFYVEMLDSARESIRLVSPYFRPTKKIRDALERASRRNVKVSLITRIDLVGDTAYSIMTDVNKLGINQVMDAIQVYESTVPNSILHTKLVIIDDKLSFLGSVNLNKRSFYHDAENGLMIYSRSFAERMRTLFDSYIQDSRLVTERQKTSWWNAPIIEILDTAF